jgi:hypothetical protein
VKAITRLRRQHQATQKLINAAKAMYESVGVSQEMRDALEDYDGRKNRPMIDWVNTKIDLRWRDGVDGL